MLYLLAFLAFCLIFSKLVCGRWIPLSYGSDSASASLDAYWHKVEQEECRRNQ